MTNAAVFFDRDGTLIEDPGYLNHPDQVNLLDGAGEALKELQQLGYKTVVVSNQSGVARGIVTEEVLEQIHHRLQSLLARLGTSLDGIYYCPYHPEAVIPKYRRDSDWRKPRPGMLLAAAQEMDIDLSRSWMVGNSPRDMEAGRSAGCQTILIGSTGAAADDDAGRPDHIAVNIREAVNMIKRFRRAERLQPSSGDSVAAKETFGDSDYTVTRLEAEQLTAESQQGEPPLPQEEPTLSERDDSQLLAEILEQLKRMQKTEMFGEVSIMRLLAGVVQAFVPFCLLMALWFLMSPDRQDSRIFISLGFAGVLQMMAMTFYIMQGRR